MKEEVTFPPNLINFGEISLTRNEGKFFPPFPPPRNFAIQKGANLYPSFPFSIFPFKFLYTNKKNSFLRHLREQNDLDPAYKVTNKVIHSKHIYS